MLYELRVYEVAVGKMPALLQRFERSTLAIWKKHGIRPAGFWTTVIGASNQRLTYMLAWELLAERELKWSAFTSDPQWQAVRAETERDGALVERLSNEILQPTTFSSVQ